MKFSSKVEKCGLSPMRKFHPYAVAAKARGVNIYHLNIGQSRWQTSMHVHSYCQLMSGD